VLAEIRVLRGRVAQAGRALEPIEALLAGELPFITGWERTKAMLALAAGRPAEAVEWCRLEGRWQPAPSDEGLAPETRLVLAAALRLSGDHEAAGRTLAALENAPLTPSMPRIRAGVLDERALLVQDSDPEGALRLHHEALRVRMDHDLALGCLASLESLAELNLRRGSAETAGMLAGALERAREDAGAAARPRPQLPDEVIERGREMDLQSAVAYAAKARGPRRRPDAGWASLTPAEQSVVELAVQGLSNVEIGARLFIGRGTVKTHLAHVYAKLQVANRTELARLAAELAGVASGAAGDRPSSAGRSRAVP